MSRVVFILALLLLTGCEQYQQVKSGRNEVGSFSVTTEAPIWNSVPSGHSPGSLPTWTVDGVTLNSLSFVSGIKDGSPLVTVHDKSKYPVFHSDMLPNEIAELVQSTVARLFTATISRTGELKPLTISGQPGFELEFEFVTDDEVIRRAFVGGTVKNGELQVVVFQAPRMHYFEKDFGHARDLIVSAKLP
ncbi:MAG: hypothetical protein HY749_18710 [Gammaproteobacteria bacterium]|nr:hypothetical protein [Gammaproteobacteria bacterium]MBI5615613.1 hypothetical protein [Gammaproteobacteria bacterium]